MKKLKLDLPLLLAGGIDTRDECIYLLTDWLLTAKGIEQAHITQDRGAPQLCLHYDPNLLTLSRVKRLAQMAGAGISDRYRHEQIAFAGMDAADAAITLTQTLRKLLGMLHAQVNYAAGLVFVAYDSTLLQRPAIEQAIRAMGFKILPPAPGLAGAESSEHKGHDHGSAPGFLPHWMQEGWPLVLASLAGLFFLIGWVGETFFGAPESMALVFFILAYIAGSYDIATRAIPGLFKGKFDTDVLMLAAAGGAAILGQWSEGAFLLFLFSLGHAGEHYALDRARNAVNALGELMPKRARVKRGAQIVEEPVDRLQLSDVALVRPGDRIPVDGEIISGASAIDQSPITGESVPVEKGVGEEVFAGTINHSAALEVKVTKLSRDNTLSRVMQMVAEAQAQQSPTQQFTQGFTAKFVPGALIFVVLATVLPPLFAWMPLQDSFYRAMLLLVAASPCALALGTPAAVLTGIAQAARNGVLIKGGVHLENLGALKVMAFDKSGTLSEGKFKVTGLVTFKGYKEEELLRVAAAVEQQSNHPLALAVTRAAKDRGLDLPPARALENIAGRGVRSEVNGQPVLIGSLKLFRETDGHSLDAEVAQSVERLENQGKTTMIVSQNGVFLGILALADAPRPGVKETLQKLSKLGVQKLVMLTGDNDAVARQIAKDIGVSYVKAELLPEQKLEVIRQLQQEYGAVAMTGDGVNDAPALAAATVGIAMGGAGAAVALETADVALMADDLSKLPFAVGLSRASRAIIKQNLAVSLGVIGLLVVTSALGLASLSWTVVLHEGSTIVVVLNALRLLRFRAV